MTFRQKLSSILLHPLVLLRNLFLSGILVVVPMGITIWMVGYIFYQFNNLTRFLEKQFQIEFLHWIPGYIIGLVLTISLISLIGFSTKLYIGNKMLQLFEYLLHRIPVISSIYSGIKQVSEQLVGSQRRIIKRVVMIEYPRKGLYSLAFVTAPSHYFVPLVDKKLVYVFIPTTPNPTSGVFLIVPEENLIDTGLTIEEAMKLVISSGMVSPIHLPPAELHKQYNQGDAGHPLE